MGWVKLDDRYRTNPKALAAGAEGVALDVAGLCFVAENETDGFIPEAVVPGLYPVRNPKKVAGVLVEVGRWVRDDERRGYWIHDYLEFNPSKAELEEKREATKDRVSDWRNKRRNAGGNTGRNLPSNSVTPPVGNAGRTPSSPSSSPFVLTSVNNSSSVVPVGDEETLLRKEAERRLANRKGAEPVNDPEAWIRRTMDGIRYERAQERAQEVALAARWGETLARTGTAGRELIVQVRERYGADRERRLTTIRATRAKRRVLEESA